MPTIRTNSRYTHAEPVVVPDVFHFKELPKRQFALRNRRQELVQVKSGWYLDKADLPTDRYERYAAVHLAKIYTHGNTLPQGVLISHFSAGVLLGFPLIQEVAKVEVANFRKTQFSRAGVRVYSRPEDNPWLVIRDAVRATSYEITAVEMMRQLSPADALVIADFAVRIGCPLEELQTFNLELKMPRMRTQTERILALADPGAESPQESRLRYRVLSAGLGKVTTQHQIRTDRGVFYLDIAIAELKIAIEYDGESKYFDSNDLIREKLREDAIRAQGWEFIRVTKADLRNSSQLVRKMKESAMRRGWRQTQ
ncbi:hypothetical protein V5R04_11045 [Jonesiaceae bacterium BS-20]|uniref:DUF559 domain-containing protein n=1 Tax=Jonesiaceae bacterium BS-20 TaxID=3120821 RepID=A0AAU7DTZ3_9MICO